MQPSTSDDRSHFKTNARRLMSFDWLHELMEIIHTDLVPWKKFFLRSREIDIEGSNNAILE